MSLTATLQVGKTALASTQAAIQTVGTNISGASDPNYTRQVAHIGSAPGKRIEPGIFLGTGVQLQGIERQIDNALMQRLRGGIADGQGAQDTAAWLEQVEAVFNELGDEDLSTQMSTFFNAWGTLAGRPTDVGTRQTVIEEGRNLAHTLNELDRQLNDVLEQNADRLGSFVTAADSLASRIADLNSQISQAEAGAGASANSLRDQRDALLSELAGHVNIHTIEQSDGAVNVYVGSEPLVQGQTSNGLILARNVDARGTVHYDARLKTNNATLAVRSGHIGGSAEARRTIEETRDALDALTAGLVFELNQIHAAGQGMAGIDDATGATIVADPAVALDSDGAGLDFPPRNGSFVVHLRDKSDGHLTSTLIDVALDGSASGASLSTLAADLDAVDGITATVVGGRLRLRSDSPGQEITFSQDSSGALASLGINTFFTGDRAGNIGVSARLDDPRNLAVAGNNNAADNATAKAIASLQERPLDGLGGATLTQTYGAMIFRVSSATSSARDRAESAESVRQTLETQRQSLSGVSLDEEAVKLMRYQRSYQGAARLIAAVDEMMQTVLQLV